MIANRNRVRAIAGVLLALGLTADVQANMLVDPGYESNPLTTATNVLTNFSGFEGDWGVENALIVGAENGVTPIEGVKMLRMDDDGNVTTQGFQTTDISSLASFVDAGTATVTLDALFNVDAHVQAAAAGVYIQFFSANNYGSQIGTGMAGSLSLDNSDATWESASVSLTVPVGTRWLMSQVYYNDASLIGTDGIIHPGYVDDTNLRVTPEPATICLLALGAVGLFRRRRA